MSKTFFTSLLTAFIPISALNHIAERDTNAVRDSERTQLSSAFDDSHMIELAPQPANDSLLNPHQAVQIILHNRQTTGISIVYHFSSNANIPLQIVSPQPLLKMSPESSAFYTSPANLQKIYKTACQMIANYRPTTPLFGTNYHTIRGVRETDTVMYRALMACPRPYQDIRINKP